MEVFARDGWVCQVCDAAVDPVRRYPDPLSASLDHVLPLSRGGDHSRDNSRLAHLICNVKRGNAQSASANRDQEAARQPRQAQAA
jgi:5-methylcytosine-specific restriction endonuclease McrA